ncbi:CCA tRNA nucleotidyltransferase [Chloroflexota bacterium]
MKLKLEEGWLNNHPLLQKVAQITREHQTEIYLVGGAVRDLLLRREAIVDLDFAVPDDGLAIARQVANTLNAAFYPLDIERGTGRVVYDDPNAYGPQKSYLDFATFRGATLPDDLSDRDFTINAMALNLADPDELIDPHQGQRDLAAGQIQVVSEAAFGHDPARVLRAIRQATEFNFSIETQTQQLLSQATPRLADVSPERQRDELVKLLNTPAPGQAGQMLHRLHVLPHILPEVEAMSGISQSSPHHLDVFDHTTAALDAWATMRLDHFPEVPAGLQTAIQQYLNDPLAGDINPQILMPLALLLHDTGKPLTRTQQADKIRFLGHEKESAKITHQVMQRLRFSGQAIGFVEKVAAHHMRPLMLAQEGKVSRRAIYRLFRDTTGGNYQAGITVALHALADHRATYPPGQGQAEEEALLEVINKLIAAYFEQRNQVVNPPPLLTGRDLIKELGLSPGRLIGLLLNRLKEAQAVGQVQARDEALDFIKADPDFQTNKEGSDQWPNS